MLIPGTDTHEHPGSPSAPVVPGPPGTTLASVRRLLDTAPARLGEARLLCIDGPSGSGKTHTARAVAAHLRGAGRDARLLHMEDHYDGWDGLGTAPLRMADLLTRLASGRSASYRAYDWIGGAFGESRAVAAVDSQTVVVVEGVGAGAAQVAGWRSVLVWVEAPAALRLRRALERDGAQHEPELRAWARSEQTHFDAHGTRAAADLRLDQIGRIER